MTVAVDAADEALCSAAREKLVSLATSTTLTLRWKKYGNTTF